MSLFRLPEPLPRDACRETGVRPPHPSRGRDLSAWPCARTSVEDPHESSDAHLRRREKYLAAVMLAAAISTALAQTAWAGGPDAPTEASVPWNDGPVRRSGPARPAHILTPSVTARGILNMTAVAAVEAQERAGRQQPSLFG